MVLRRFIASVQVAGVLMDALIIEVEMLGAACTARKPPVLIREVPV